MNEITNGIRALLSYSQIYNLFQKIMGGKQGRTVFASQYIRSQQGDCILDIGCGTAEIRDFLPQVEYFGFDPNPHYIEAAKIRLNNVPGCTLHPKSLNEAILNELPKFDIVLAIGVLHHLNDDSVIQLADLAKATLKNKGRLITLDPCYVEGQSRIARFLISHDRGQHVRNVEGYRHLMDSVFNAVKFEIRHDLIRFPYTHLIMESTF